MFNPIVEEGKAIFFLEYAHVKPAFPAGLQGRHGEFESGKGPIFYILKIIMQHKIAIGLIVRPHLEAKLVFNVA